MSGWGIDFWMIWSMDEEDKDATLHVTEVREGFIDGCATASPDEPVNCDDTWTTQLGDEWRKKAEGYAAQARPYLPPNCPSATAPGRITIHIIRERGETVYG